MTNEQLAILIRGYHDELRAALSKVTEALPPDELIETKYFLGTYHEAPILDPFNDVINAMGEDIEKLLRK